MAVKTGLEGKPWYVGLGVGLVVGGLLFGAGYWRLLQPGGAPGGIAGWSRVSSRGDCHEANPLR